MQNAWLRPYIDISTDLRKKAWNNFENDSFKLTNKQFSEKLLQIWQKNKDIELATTERRRNFFVSEPNYRTAKFFTVNLLAIKMKTNKRTKINK